MTTTFTAPIKNFHRVTDWLYRGAQPTEEGIQHLAGMGVKTVLSLRCGRRGSKAEKLATEAAGMHYESIPLSYWKVPTEATIDRFLELLDDPSNHPIFVHCFHGADRTGLLVATYRISRQGWTFQESYDEMKRFGFHRFGVRHFKWVLWFYAQKAQRNLAGNNQPLLSVKRT